MKKLKWKELDKIFSYFVRGIAFFSFFILSFIIIFIVKESLPLFKEMGVTEFIFGKRWYPSSYSNPSMGIFNIIIATIYIAVIGVAISFPIGLGCSIFLSCVLEERIKNIVKPYIDILAGIPSVIYGFMGLLLVVKFFEKLGRPSGESVLAGGVVLSIMILPFIVDNCEETMSKIREKYESSSKVLGVSKWYMISELVVPASKKSMVISVILALARALGETMAVMMVIGNAPVFPTLLGKAQTISSLIALEMGMTEVGSTHYNALFASGLSLLIIILSINLLVEAIKKRFLGVEL